MTTTDIELHPEHIAALQAMNDNDKQFIFLTGNAGTGKSTFLLVLLVLYLFLLE